MNDYSPIFSILTDKVGGCTNPNSPNYSPGASCDDGSCITCCNAGLCSSGTTNLAIGNGYCDEVCVSLNDCSPTYTNSFTATACDGSTIEYKSCQSGC